MSLILWRSSLRYLFMHPWQAGLSVLGVALGVAVVVSIDLANQSAKEAFALSTDVVAGRATHHIVGGPGGLPEDVYRTLRVDNGVRTSAPVVAGYASVVGSSGGVLQLLGIDPFAEAPFRPYLSNGANADINALFTQPGAALLSADTAASLNLAIGDTLDLSIGGFRHTIQLVGIIEPSDEVSRQALTDLLITDISTAQELTQSQGHLSRIDLVISEGSGEAEIVQKITSFLPPGAELVRTSARSESVDQLTRAFDLNLTALSLLALIVGTFLIYNTMTFSVVRRRPLIGTLRSIGVTRGEIFTLVISEALLIGVVSAVLGVLIGILLGRGLVSIVTQTINDLFFVVTVRDLAIQPLVLIKGAVLGVVATLVAAFVPALEATSVSTRSALTRSAIEARLTQALPRATVVGALIAAVGVAIFFIPSKSLILSFMGLFSLVIGMSLLIPGATVVFIRLLTPLMGRPFGALGAMAARGVSSSLSRTAVAIAALTVAVSITVGIGTMVQSFRGTVDQWLATSLQADVYVSPPSLLSNRIEATLSPSALQGIMAAPGVQSVSTFRGANVDTPEGQAYLVSLGTDFETFNEPRRFKEGNPADIWDDFQSGEAVLVSEPYAFHQSIDIGSSVRLMTTQGEKEFRVGGIYYDYSSGQGVVMVSRNAYDEFWDDDGVSSISVYATPETDIDTLIGSLHQAAGGEQELQIRSNRDLREASLEVFDRSFAITSVMRVLAMIVAFVGVLSALMALQLERSRELGTLRALGFTPGQIWGLVTSQTGLMGLVAGLLSIPMGIVLAMGLIFVVNKRSFGWSMEMQIIPSVLIEALVLAVVASLLAGIYPAIKMAMSSAAEALREE